MDPFATLPWFILQRILCLLPDLPTLHRISQSSLAVARFLRHTRAFPKVVEKIIARAERDQGTHPKIQFYLRTLVFIWWRASTCADDDNPLPSSFEEVAYFLGKSSPEGRTLLDGFGDIHLPQSTPPSVLYRLLELSTQLRQSAHACFHDWMTRCMALRPERLKHPRDEFSHTYCHPRPEGVPLDPVDIGPPTWPEEQRLIRAILRHRLFWELKDAVMTRVLPAGEDNPDISHFRSEDIESFWCGTKSTRVQRLRTYHGTQFKAVLSWLQRRNSMESKYLYCCPELTPLSVKQLQLPDDPQLSSVPGYTWMQTINKGRCPMRGVDCTIFQRLGFDFWDEERLVALGFMLPLRGKSTRPGNYRDENELWFRWSSILTEDQWLQST